MRKKKVHMWCLSVDYEGGDGAGLFPIPEKRIKRSLENVQANFPQMLFCTYPPPKVEVVGLTKKEWERACKVGRERMK